MAIKLSTQRTNNAAESSRSRYTQGGIVDRFPNRLGWWERRIIEQDDTDINITVLPQEAGRPDLIAARAYGKATLMWLVLQYNNIVDIQTEIVPGKELRLPTEQRVNIDVLNRPAGGNRIR